MTGAAKTAAALSGIGGAGSLTVGGVYYSSKETIGSIVKDKVLGTSSEFNESWKDQHKKLLGHKGELSAELKKLKEKHTNSDLEASREALKNWCKSSYEQTYKTSLSKANESLLNEVKTYCIQSTKERLQSTLNGQANKKVLSEAGDKNDFVTNYKALKNHNPSSDGVLDTELAAWKDKADTQGDTKWADLQGWCNKHYNTPFKGETDLFKNLKKYCIKAS
ncbi:hypothetical protein HF1_01590 [Mycoplasma haemofelis str. Langford 1]|uniref:Uncharacterized protein n=2 Tax=Mycoplasma haemofelis TaxID=29501 RepID=F6FG13_MYCHI|nr:hypothetical protein [Mycoplasma haemofelis]AEG72479.1 hypothetical protein MHF_0180 [Mycoplasma haemofelis Ohio2]CBY92167.1 hypothetical protein HF1_01590 [Mycoplasma haemofelis str. Langford 1]